MPVYFTAQDADVRFLNHPEEKFTDGPSDAAHFVLTFGSSPMHIWNYGRGADSDESGEAGEVPFDDTAVGNHMARLQLVVNQKRFETVKQQFHTMSQVGDVQIKYTGADKFGEMSGAGYLLEDGQVGSTGEEITLSNATFPTISLTFKEAIPIGGASQRIGQRDAEDLLLRGDNIERREQQRSFYPHEGIYLHNGARRIYNPLTLPDSVSAQSYLRSGDPFLPDDFHDIRGREEQKTRATNLSDWLRQRDFITAFISVPEEDGRRLWAWSPQDGGYEPTQITSDHPRIAIL